MKEKNPFRFGEIVEKQDFCTRKQEIAVLSEYIRNRHSVWLFSPRRYGKSSLVFRSFGEIQEVQPIYFDLYNRQTIDDLARKYAQTLARELFDWKEDVKTLSEKFGNYFSNLLPKVSFDAFGSPSFSLGSQNIEQQSNLETILNIPEMVAKKSGRQICIAFDEFQEIHRIEPFLVNWMRSVFQRQKNVSYILLGSKQSLMESIFADVRSPFYE